MDKVAIVILNWNGATMMRRYMSTVLRYSQDDAVVYVADNASTDDSLELLRQDFPECRLITLEKNWGFADGYNKALAQVKAEYFVLLNSDSALAVTAYRLHGQPSGRGCLPAQASVYKRP